MWMFENSPDALIFAMFARPSPYDALLLQEHQNNSIKDLQIALRLFINRIRVGKIVSPFCVQNLRFSLIACGWKATDYSIENDISISQQDSSELLAFLTSTLSAPFLPISEGLLVSIYIF